MFHLTTRCLPARVPACAGGQRLGTGSSGGAGGSGDGEEDDEEEEEAEMVLARAIIRRQDIARWIFKIDGEDDGRGTAFVDISLFYEAAEALTALPEAASEEERQGVAEFLCEVIRQEMPLGCTLVSPGRWATWASFALELRARGGVLEAGLPGVTGSPAVCGFIPPGKGPVQVLSTHEQIFCAAYRVAGVSFPQQSVPHADLVAAATEILRTARLMKVVGHVGVDFVAVADAEAEAGFHLVAVDFNPFLTQAQAAFKLVEAVTHGGFDAETGAFLCPVGADAPEYGAATDSLPRLKGASARPAAFSSHRMGLLGWHPRAFTAVFSVAHPGLKNIGHFDFFKSCRHAGVNYDVSQQCGTIITLPDSLAGGTVSVVSVHRDFVAAFKGLQAALACVKQQALTGFLKSRDDDFLTEESTVDVVSSTVHFLCMRLAAAAAKGAAHGGGGGGAGTHSGAGATTTSSMGGGPPSSGGASRGGVAAQGEGVASSSGGGSSGHHNLTQGAAPPVSA